jgi:hypothetical protein
MKRGKAQRWWFGHHPCFNDSGIAEFTNPCCGTEQIARILGLFTWAAAKIDFSEIG